MSLIDHTALLIVYPVNEEEIFAEAFILNVPLNSDIVMECEGSSFHLMDAQELERSLKGLQKGIYAVSIDVYKMEKTYSSKWKLRRFEEVFRDCSGEQKTLALTRLIEEMRFESNLEVTMASNVKIGEGSTLALGPGTESSSGEMPDSETLSKYLGDLFMDHLGESII